MHRKFKQLFAHNFGLKALSALVAVFIWFCVNVSSPRDITCVIERQVEFYNEDPTLSVEEAPSVVITLRGRRLDLVAKLDQVRVGVDMRQAGGRAGPVALEVVPHFVPNRVELVDVTPKRVDLELVRAKPASGESPAPIASPVGKAP